MIEIDPSWCVAICVVVYFVVFLVQKGLHRLGGIRLETSSSRTLANFCAITFAVFFAAMFLWFAQPDTRSLHFINYPESVQDLQPSEKLLKLTQEYGKTIAQTNSVVRWFIFIIAIWLANAGGLATTILKERIVSSEQGKKISNDGANV